MNYNIQLNNGQNIKLQGANMDVIAFTKTLNEQSVIFVNIGGAIVNKHLIHAIVPIEQ